MHDSGRAVEEVLADLADRQGSDPPLHAGRLFGLVYPTGRSDIEALTSNQILALVREWFARYRDFI